MVSIIAVNLIAIAVGTIVLAVALMVTGEGSLDRDILLKCLGIVATAAVISLVPFMGILSIAVWFAMLMGVFEKTITEAFVISIVCWGIILGLRLALTGVMGTVM